MSNPKTTAVDGLARNWIDGAWNGDGTISESINPSTGKPVGKFVAASHAEAQIAIDAARTAFDQTSWSNDRSLRSRVLNAMADSLAAFAPQIALMLSREGGKLHDQTQWEVAGSIEWLRYAAATALLQTGGRAMETTPGVHFRSEVEARGVAGVISPWNSPIILSIRAIGPALAAGCTVVLKLPHQTGMTNALLSSAIASVEALPPGVLNIFTETGNDGASLLVNSAEVDVISYTGSTHIGRIIAANGAKTLKRLNLELGGKAPMIVFDDADLNVVIPQIVMALVAMNGQFCCTGSRVLVQRGIADSLRAALVGAYGQIRLGTSEDPEAQLGPLIDRSSVQRVDEYVKKAAAYGKILVGGETVTDGPLSDGAFYKPTLIEVESLDAAVVQEEVFGPVQTFELFDDEAEAIHRANGTEFGLAASIYSTDLAKAQRVGRSVRAGTIWLNCWGALSEHFEESGFKQSGIGTLCGPRAIEEFQQIKVYTSVTTPAPTS